MIELKLKTGASLTYDEEKGVVLVDGKPNRDWKPAFVPSGEDEPDFFGFINTLQGKLYDVYGNISNVSREDNITL